MANKSKEANIPGPDISQIRNPIQLSGKPVEQILNSIHYGSPELRCLLMDECDIIFECKVCRALFRDLPNFISHKRVYCVKSSLENGHVMIANLPEEKVVVIQPQSPEETEKENEDSVSTQQPKPRPTLDETIQRIQSGELGKSLAYKVYTEAAEKLQRQKEGMKIATIRTTPIPTNKNAVFIEVKTTSVNIHERQQQDSNVVAASPGESDPPAAATKNKKSGEKTANNSPTISSRISRKSAKQEKHSAEPQKILMEHLKEIQHKVKQKAAAQDAGVLPKGKSKEETVTSPRKDTGQNNEKQAKGKSNEGLSDLARQNFQSLLAKEETKANDEKKATTTRTGERAVVKRRESSQPRPSAVRRQASEAAKEIIKTNSKKNILKSLTCVKCSSIFSTRSSLGFHMKIHHSSKRVFYQCPYCPSAFYYFYGITRHLYNNHDKSADEINNMRSQIRENAVVRPVSLSKKKDKTSRAGRKPVSRNRSKNNNNSDEMPGKGVTEAAKSQRRATPSAGDKKLQQYNNEGEGKLTISVDSNGLDNSVSSMPSPAPSSASEDLTDHSRVCSKCQRSFGRKISYENHLKICQADEDLPGTHVSDKLGKSSRKNDEISISSKPHSNKPESSTKVRESTEQEKASSTVSSQLEGVGTRSRKKDSSPNASRTLANRKSRHQQRCASVDRDLSPRPSRNRSQERVAKAPGGRDSSVESTQSNVEGRMPRVRRHTPSRYAAPGITPDQPGKPQADAADKLQSTSPKKVETEVTKLVDTSQTSNPSDPNLSVTRLKTKNSSYRITVMKNVPKDSASVLPEKANPNAAGNLKSETKSGTGCPQKTYFAPRNPMTSVNSSIHSPTSPYRELGSPKKISPSTFVCTVKPRSLQQKVGLEAKVEPTVKTESGLFYRSQELGYQICSAQGVPITKVLCTTVNSSHQAGQTPVTHLSSGHTCEKTDASQIKSESNAEKTDTPRSIQETNVEKSDVKSLRYGELLKEYLLKDEGSSFKSTEQAASPRIPTPALSERPKRKRKVPTRSLDAEEMLSKIHKHNREPVPYKRARLSETKAQPVRSGNTRGLASSDAQDSVVTEGGDDIKSKPRGNTRRKDMEDEDSSSDDDDDEEEEEEPVKGKGRVVSNRIYVLEKSKSKVHKLRCYDQSKVYKLIDEANAKCLQCGEQFTQVSNLRRHVIRQHLKWSRFKCRLCKFECYDRSECNTHILRTHMTTVSRKSTKSIKSLIIDLVKQGSKVRSLKKTNTLRDKQQSEKEGNIYARPTVKRVPRLPQRSAMQSSENISMTTSDGSDCTVISPEPGMNSDSSSSSRQRESPRSRTTDRQLTGRGMKNLPFNISTRNSPRTFDTSPYRRSFIQGAKSNLQTRKSRFPKHVVTGKEIIVVVSPETHENGVKTNPGAENTESVENIFEKLRRESTSSEKSPHKIHTVNDEQSEDMAGKVPAATNGSEPEGDRKPHIVVSDSEGEKSQRMIHIPQSKLSEASSSLVPAQQKLVAGDNFVTKHNLPLAQKGQVKYIITSPGTQPAGVFGKIPKTVTLPANSLQKPREAPLDTFPALSEQVAKSLMKLKKLGDNMSTSGTVVAAPGSTPAQGQEKLTKIAMNKGPVTTAQIRLDSSQGKSLVSSLPPSLPTSGANSSKCTPSIVLSHGSSGKIIVYTHAAEEKQSSVSSSTASAPIFPPSSSSTSTITVRSKEAGGRSTPTTTSEEDGLPSGTFVIHQHFI
ncbi:uncharacterized protein LOC131955883 [Physella acuta]|uniref:uncharacterized protein LOC131955883 n=1 Tax=Physella acuta TaxID=109671 RepID=UPI0027DD31A4|nr:uncharacterized protein LOC131955883 [Physella acuta]